MKAPLIKILLPFVLGIVLAEVLDVPATTAFLLAALCALAMVGVQFLPRRRERLTTGLFRPLLYAAFLLLGLGLATLQREAVVTSFPPEPCTMELRLCEMPASSERYVKASAILEWTHNSDGSRPYPKGTRTLVYLDNDSLFSIQSEVIRKLAAEQSCLFIGRCTDYILRDNPRCVNLFITAPHEARLARIMKRHPEYTSQQIEGFMQKADRQWSAYYTYYTGKTWGAASSYHLSIDSSLMELDATVEFLRQFIVGYLHL